MQLYLTDKHMILFVSYTAKKFKFACQWDRAKPTSPKQLLYSYRILYY